MARLLQQKMTLQSGFMATIILSFCCLIAACTQQHALSTHVVADDDFYGTPDEYGSEDQDLANRISYASSHQCTMLDETARTHHYRADKPLLIASSSARQQMQGLFTDDLPLSPGDLVELTLINGDDFAGRYVINPDGKIQLPMLPAIEAGGVQLHQLAEQLELALVRNELFLPGTARVGLRVLQWAPIEVTVSGAVFEPGRVLINDKLPSQIHDQRISAFGDYTPSRYLSEALRAASGVRPDAKVDQIILIRNGWQLDVDLSGVLSGHAVKDVALVAGDRIVVPTTGCFQTELVRPSQITPKGFRVYMSNLTKSAESNSNAAVGNFSSNLPYGTRLLQAAVSANCVGGTSWTNAPRKVLLASKNPLTGRTEVVERSIEKLVRKAENEQMNPYLMPNDAIACYDSDVTNVRDIARTVLEIVTPIKLLAL
jgi:protein involved in polysaccharide export with SLBB domain